MANKTFVSYAFSDAEIVHSGASFTQNSGGQIPIEFLRVKKFVGGKGPKAINTEIKRVMSQCDSALFVVGNNNHNSFWIKREVELATSKGLKIVVARVPGTTGAIPEPLARQGKTEVRFTPKAIANELSREGK